MTSIVTLAMNPAVDKSAAIDRVIPEHKLRCSKPRYDPGGGGINVARAVRKLGGRAAVYYTSGRSQGRLLETLLDREGLDHHPMRIDGRTRVSFCVDETATGQQYRFSTPGPDLEQGEWERCLRQMTSLNPKPDYLVVSGSIPPGVPADFYARLAHGARRANVRMVLDATGEPFREALQAGVFLIKPNLREFSALVDTGIGDESRQVAAAERLIAEGRAEMVVVSLGAAGALLVWGGGCQRLRAPTVSIKSKVGAGDSMVAGIVTAMSEGAAPVEAAQYGLAAGAAAVMTPGTALCRLDDTKKLYQVLAEERSRQSCPET